jgi:alkylation response protein AidB-like acyl-CoA dehydrogenase
MRVELNEDQELFRSSTRRFLELETPISLVRELYEARDGFDRAWWRTAAELGWTSLLVAERLGGGTLSGRPNSDAVIVAEEMGRLVAPGPFVPVNVVAASVATSGSDLQHSSLLPGLLTGEVIATWAFCEPQHRWHLQDVATTATMTSGGDVVLAGSKAYVEALGCADHILTSARTGDGFTQVLVPVDTPGVTVTRGRSIDMTRRFGSIQFDGALLPGTAVVGEIAGAADQITRQLHLAIALQCAELVGVADRTLEFTMEYGRERTAFGRPIVSYQALKHRIADMAVQLEGAKAVTDALAAAIDDDADDVGRLASVAKAYVGTHALDIVDDCVQITGGIGVTWEHDIHLYNRRATVNRAVYGTPEDHKQQLLPLLLAMDEGST